MNSEKEVSRRQLLSGAGVMGGALILSRLVRADENAPGGPPDAGDEENDGKSTQIAEGQLVLRLNDNPELGKVGGWKIFEMGEDRVIVANTEKGIIACSAICTHKGCDVAYKADVHQFVCPCHGARYDEDGKVVRGPAKADLQKYSSDSALILSKP